MFDSISPEERDAGAVPSLEPTFDLAPSSPRFAARAMFCSSLVHLAVLMVVLGFPWQIFLFHRSVPSVAVRQEALLLPPLGSGGGGSAPGGGGQPSPGKSGASAPGAGKRAPQMIFRGPQPIVSNPPNPDNSLQTIRQPDLFRPPQLKQPIPSPNIVLMAPSPQPPAAKPAQRTAVKAVRSGAPIPIAPQPLEDLQPPKLTLPPSGETELNIMGALPANQPAAPKLETPPAPVITQEGSDTRNLLVLNATPAPIPPPSSIPAGELSGAFTVSPNPNAEADLKAAPEDTGAGTTGGTGAQGSGTGSQAGPGAGTGASGSGSGGGGGSGEGGNGSGGGPGIGTGPGAGGGPGGSGQGAGGGRGSGGTGSGSGTGGNLGGPGGSGGGPFKDVAIAGSPRLQPPSSSLPKRVLPHQTFSLTIVATSSTGGGLKDYGVFKDQVVYTVYVDMDEPGHHRPRWTLQYAEIGRPSDSAPAKAVLLPPYPAVKELPHLPEVASRHVGRMILAKGVVNKKGELTALKVIQSPNPLLIEPVLDSLAKWTFEAAELDGEPIEVRVLLGIPISADLIEDREANTAK